MVVMIADALMCFKLKRGISVMQANKNISKVKRAPLIAEINPTNPIITIATRGRCLLKFHRATGSMSGK